MTGILESMALELLIALGRSNEKQKEGLSGGEQRKRRGNQFDIPTAELSSCTYTNIVDEGKSEGR